jgi:Tfp pilus assembly protein PilO
MAKMSTKVKVFIFIIIIIIIVVLAYVFNLKQYLEDYMDFIQSISKPQAALYTILLFMAIIPLI